MITVEETEGAETKIGVVEGMQFDRGCPSPCFVTKRERMEAIVEAAASRGAEKPQERLAKLVGGWRCCAAPGRSTI